MHPRRKLDSGIVFPGILALVAIGFAACTMDFDEFQYGLESTGGSGGSGTTSSTGGTGGTGTTTSSGGTGGGTTTGGTGGTGGGTGGSGGDPGFLPTDLAGLELWLRADQGITLDGSDVSEWADQSGQGNDATQGSANAQPTFGDAAFNGHPAVDFDGSDDFLEIADAAGLDPGQGSFLCMAAGRWLGGVGASAWFGKSSSAQGNNWRLTRLPGGSLRIYWGDNSEYYTAGTTLVNDNVDHVIGWGVDAATDEVIYVVDDDIERLPITLSGAGQNGSPARIGADLTGMFATIRMAEHVFYTRSAGGFSDQELTDLADYLAAKYGL